MRILVFPLALLLAAGAAAQVSSHASNQSVPRPANAVAPITSPTLIQLQQAANNLRVDLASLRIGKWKDKDNREQAQANAESLDRNLQLALPGMIQEAQAQPGSMGAQFKLYRNLNALYDVLHGLTESAGAFAPKDEFSALSNDLSAFDQLRRQMGDQLQSLAQQKDEQMARLAANARAAAPAAAPKKIVVDDTVSEKPSKKTVHKKPAAKPEPHP